MVVKKKVCIATLELGENYGGMLQAYALQRVLGNMGYIAETTHFQTSQKNTKLSVLVKQPLKIMLHYIRHSVSDMPLNSREIITEKTRRFVVENIKTIDSEDFRRNWKERYGALIVGSDQVWRQAYVPVREYMLNFSTGANIVRISYAASFGRDDLSEYSAELIQETALLARDFDAISVREDSGVSLVEKSWRVEAYQHVDPTLLIERSAYDSIIEDKPNESVGLSENSIFAYVLDREGDKGAIIDRVATSFGFTVFDFMPAKTNSRKQFKSNIKRYQLGSVEQWVRSFRDAEFVVTDSFHGCVFSIIFNKSFIAIGNNNRGLARFTSLLKTFGLEDRLVSSVDEVTEDLISRPIDWTRVNKKIKSEQKRSFDYLKKNLG